MASKTQRVKTDKSLPVKEHIYVHDINSKYYCNLVLTEENTANKLNSSFGQFWNILFVMKTVFTIYYEKSGIPQF